MVCLLTPCSRTTSPTVRPASTCFSAVMICASVCLLRLIPTSPSLRPNRIPKWTDFRGQVTLGPQALPGGSDAEHGNNPTCAAQYHAHCRMPYGSNRSAQNPVPGLRPLPGSDDVDLQPFSHLACLNFIMQSTLRKEWPYPDGYKRYPASRRCLVEQCDAAAHRFQNVVEAVRRAEDHLSMQARGRYDITKVCIKWSSRRLSSGLRYDSAQCHAAQLLRVGNAAPAAPAARRPRSLRRDRPRISDSAIPRARTF